MATRGLGCVCLSIFILFSQVLLTLECGVVTHTEIAERAIHHFADENLQFTYQKLIRKHEDAFQAGNPYPDAFYPSVCAGGIYHNVSEDTHWSEFINVTLNYIQKNHPAPWDEATEKLVVFVLGLVSHQVADISWHNLGISQGFLQTMANINFHKQFEVAHTAGDFGGDVFNVHEMNLGYSKALSDWYVPTEDLYNIYTEYYGKEQMPKNVITECTTILFLARLGEHLALGELYADYSKKSPFLLDQLSDYFIGGMDDMAAWTQIIWRNIIHMLEHGQSGCYVPHNPLFITCNKTSIVQDKMNIQSARDGGIPVRLLDHGLTMDDIEVEPAHRGIKFRASKKLKAYIKQKTEKHRTIVELSMKNKLKDNQVKPDSVLTIPESYAKFGWALSVGDLNADGREDLAVGAPGHGSEFAPQDGRVFIIYGTDDGLPVGATQNIYSAANITLIGPQGTQSRFGSSIAILDLNLDGVNDIAVGAPNYGSKVTPLQYNGMVYVYYGSREDRYRFSRVNMTISCKDTYCTNGWTLSVGDLNGDKRPDLILGSPWAPAGGEQRGFVGAVFASKKYKAETSLSVDSLDWIQKGQQDYGWFGSDVSVKVHQGGEMLLVNQPTYRDCVLSNCNYSMNDTQSVGRLNVYNLTGNAKPVALAGTHSFQSFGASFDIGHPLPGGEALMAVSATREDVQGKLANINTEFSQSGLVHLLNISNHTQPFQQVAALPGDRRYGRFGAKVKFADLNMDGLDDLIVTAPFRTDDITEELYGAEEGRVYIYMGGDKFPKGDNAFYNCGGIPLVEPCPGLKATYELVYGEEKARFGSNVAVLKSKNIIHLVVTAIHGNSQEGRLSGVVTLYNFPRS